MNPKTKKMLLIGGGVIVAGAAIWYFFLRKKGSSGNLNVKKVEGTLSKALKQSGVVSKAKTAKGTQKPVEQTQ